MLLEIQPLLAFYFSGIKILRLINHPQSQPGPPVVLDEWSSFPLNIGGLATEMEGPARPCKKTQEVAIHKTEHDHYNDVGYLPGALTLIKLFFCWKHLLETHYYLSVLCNCHLSYNSDKHEQIRL